MALCQHLSSVCLSPIMILLTSAHSVSWSLDDGVAWDEPIANMDPLRRRLPLEAGHDGWEEPQGLVNARLEVSELPQGTCVEVAACYFGRKELVDLFLQGLVHLRVRRKIVEQAGECCGRCVAAGNYDETCVSYQVFSLLPAWVGRLLVVFQYPVEYIRNVWLVLQQQPSW